VEDQEQGERTPGPAGEVDEQEHDDVIADRLQDRRDAVEARIDQHLGSIPPEDPRERRVVRGGAGGDREHRNDGELEAEPAREQRSQEDRRCGDPPESHLPLATALPQQRPVSRAADQVAQCSKDVGRWWEVAGLRRLRRHS